MTISGQELAAVPKMCVFWDFETLSWSSNGCQLNPDLTSATETVFIKLQSTESSEYIQSTYQCK